MLILVEKDNIISLSIKTRIENLGFKIIIFKNLVSAQLFYTENFKEVEAVILNLENCNICSYSISVFTKIRTDLIIIGLNETELRCESFDCFESDSISCFVKKPFIIDELIDEIRKIINS